MIIHNPTETKVSDYPIQDPKSGDVSLWSIGPGETLDFPEFAGKYLVEVYRFLQRIVTSEQLSEEQEQEAKLSKGQHFSQVKVVGGATNEKLGTPVATPEELKPRNPELTPPALQPEMVGQIEGDEADKVEGLPVPVAQATSTPTAPVQVREPKEGKLICPECKNGFQNKAALKTHYAHAHLVIPGIS